MSQEKTLILTHDQITQKIDRIAYQIIEDNHKEKEIYLVGIDKNGYSIAESILNKLKTISSKTNIELVKLSIDKDNPVDEQATSLDIETAILEGKVIILIDDVLNSGKTLIYGVRYLLSIPIKRMSTAVLVDRNNKKYPIGTHYIGLALSTTMQNHISIEYDKKGKMSAYLS